MDIFDAALVASALRLSAPLILAALGGLFTEKGGVTNIALDGIMIFGAFCGAVIAFETSDPWAGLIAAMFVGALIALIHGIASIRLNGDQIVSATAINIMAIGLPAMISNYLYESTGVTPNIPNLFPSLKLPFLAAYPALNQLLNNHSYILIFAFAAIPITWFVINHTIFGLRLRACGENPEAADASGVNVYLTRMYGVILSGVLAGMAGAFLSIAHGSSYVRDISAGRGYIALAALIFGRYSPWGVLFSCLLFGVADALQIRLQNILDIPIQFVQIFPYLLAIIVLAGFMGRSPVPEANGKHYIK